MKIMISGHGGRYGATTKMTVPPNVALHFFVHDNASLSNDRSVNPNAWAIYDSWATVTAPLVESFTAGQQVYDYYCWEMTDAVDGVGTNAASGVFDVSKTKIESLQAEASAQQLSTLIPALAAKYPGQALDIYWAACRSVD